VTRANAAHVARLCHRLEGIPLALELAAARARMLPPRAMVEALADRLSFLGRKRPSSPPRHRSLRAALDWSYDLLPPDLRHFFARLSVFRGGFTVEATARIFEEPSAPEFLARLRDHSLVVREDAAGRCRYRLLETLREYGASRLTAAERADLARRHAEYFLTLAETAHADAHGPGLLSYLDRLEAEHDNLRAALSWAIEARAAELGLRGVVALSWFWIQRGYLAEGRARVDQMLSIEGEEGSPIVRAWALASDGLLAAAEGEHRSARARLLQARRIARALDRAAQGNDTEVSRLIALLWNDLGLIAQIQHKMRSAWVLQSASLARARAIGDRGKAAAALNDLGNLARVRGEYETARQFLRESLAEAELHGDPWRLAWVHMTLGYVATAARDDGEAATRFDQALSLWHSLRSPTYTSAALWHMGAAALRQGNLARAESYYEQSLRLQRGIGDRDVVAGCLEGLAGVLLAKGRHHNVACLCGASAALRDSCGAPIALGGQVEFDRLRDAARAALGEAKFAAAWNEGCAMTWNEAIQYAVRATDATELQCVDPVSAAHPAAGASPGATGPSGR
jgi:tetratricopeptide (TPR) repeat protein